ncbi:MAG: beta-galactosidase, partial [Deltaproteobacteria bacterium]
MKNALPGLALAAVAGVVTPAAADRALPRLEHRDGRHALLVDGQPFLMLGVQANNSSNYPAVLPQVWPMLERLHANTLEIPVAWEQIEPVEGRFDFSWLDALIPQARERGKRLVLLWFATWKNTGPSCAP